MRKFCSNACQRRAEQAVRLEEWLRTGSGYAGSRKGHYMRTYIIESQSHLCAICQAPDEWHGSPLVFVLDHIDGDSSNNRRDNLRLVCPNCDSQLPTFKARNRGRGRHFRRERYAKGQSH